MSIREVIEKLGGWTGYILDDIKIEAASQTLPSKVVISLAPDPSIQFNCHVCGSEKCGPHDLVWREIRDLPVFQYVTVVRLQRVRIRCYSCGVRRVQPLEWLDKSARFTKRLAEAVARLTNQLPIKHVANWYHLHWDTVRSIHSDYLEEKLGPVCLDGLVQLAMDEFAIHKGHRYATIVADAVTRRVVWVCRGRSRESVRPFFQALGPERAALIKAVTMDMNTAHDLEVKLWCPNAEVIYDLFHVIAKYGREVIDRVRVDQANKLRDDKPARKIIKRSRWILLRNRKNLSDADAVHLQELFEANQPLSLAYILREDLKLIWESRNRNDASQLWTGWFNRAMESGVDALQTFAVRLRSYLPGILAHCEYPLNTGFLEGINNTVKVIKRMAYGYRDEAYFFLRIRAAFPGKP